MKKVVMVVPSFSAKGGISSVVNGYRGSELEKKYKIKYIESYCCLLYTSDAADEL